MWMWQSVIKGSSVGLGYGGILSGVAMLAAL
jgi:hypothetical protein